jgi:hypothetical protein
LATLLYKTLGRVDGVDGTVMALALTPKKIGQNWANFQWKKRDFFPHKGISDLYQTPKKSYSYFMYLIPRYKWMSAVCKAPRLRPY